MCQWECDGCGRIETCDPVCGDEDADGNEFGIGPDCPDCDQMMDYIGDTATDDTGSKRAEKGN